MEEYDRDDVDKIKKMLRDTSGMWKPVAWRAMINRRISPGQSLDAACEEFHKWAKIVAAGCNPVSEIATVAFIEALPTAVAQKVRILCRQTASRTEVLEATKDVWDSEIGEVVVAARQPEGEKPQT